MEILILFFIAFFAGAIGILAPCTFPLIPAFLANLGLSTQGKLTKNSLYFALGVALMFTILGLAAGFLGKFIAEHRMFLGIASGIIISIFGIYVIFGIRPRELKKHTAKTRWQSFGLGVIFTFAWSGCIGPVVAIILLIAVNLHHTLLGGALLFVYALGVLLPLLLIARIIDALPRDGRVWKLLKGKLITVRILGREKFIHSTNLFAGIIFILLGIFLILNNYMTLTVQINSTWVYDLQERLLDFVNVSKIK